MGDLNQTTWFNISGDGKKTPRWERWLPILITLSLLVVGILNLIK